MARYSHSDWGDITNHIFAKGVITAVDSENDTADVTVEGYKGGKDTPLFYHCDPDSEERANGAIEGAAAGFSVDDEVIVMCTNTGAPVRIIGFVDGIKACFGYMVVRVSSYCCVWDFSKNAMATDVYVNDHLETMAEFPILTSEISQWIESKDEVVFDDLFSQENKDGSYEVITDDSTDNTWSDMHECSGTGGELGGTHGNEKVYNKHASDPNLFGGVDTYEMTGDESSFSDVPCPEEGREGQYIYSKSTVIAIYSKYGFRLTALNGSEDILDFYKTITKTDTFEQDNVNHTPYPENPWYRNECDSYSKDTTSTIIVTGTSSYLTLDGGTKVDTYSASGCNTPEEITTSTGGAPLGIYIGFAGYYSEQYGAIAQLFINKDADDNYQGYGTADGSLSDITIAPTTLSEQPALSVMLKTLAETAGAYSGIQAQFYK